MCIYVLNDRLITLVKLKSSITAVIFIVGGILQAGESKFSINKNEINECIFKGHVLEFYKFEDNKFIWSGEYVADICKVTGNLCIEFETQVFKNFFLGKNLNLYNLCLTFDLRLWLLMRILLIM